MALRELVSGAPRVRDVQRVLHGRRSRAGAGELSYRVYMTLMLIIAVAAPIVRIGVLWISDAYVHANSSQLAAVLTAATALLVLAGSLVGPAYAGLAPLDLLYTTALPRHRLFAQPVIRGMVAGAFFGGVLGAMVVAARVLRADSELILAVAVLASATAIGVLAAFAMLLGQLGRGIRWLFASALALLVYAQLFLGFANDPWTGLAAAVLAESGVAALLPSSLLALASALFLAGAAPMLAGRLRWQSLREQATRWDTIHVTAGTGDSKAALDWLGAPVRVGRGWRLRPARTLTATILRRDLLGCLRTPARSLLGCGGVAVALWLWHLAMLNDTVWGAAALFVASVSLQPWCRGLAAAAAGVGSPQILPTSPRGLLLRHALMPGVLSLIMSVLGALGLTVFYGLDVAGFCGVLMSQALLLACALALRVTAALKGSLPMRLLAPSPTPMGDFSGITVALWMADGPVLSLLAGALLGVLWGAAVSSVGVFIWAVFGSLAVLGGLLWLARARLRG